VEAIHRAPKEGAAMESCDAVVIREDHGIEGDRYAGRTTDAHVTVVSTEQLAEAGRILGHAIPPGATRRNVTVSGIDLRSEAGARIEVGDIILEVTGPADPCRIMERSVGPGAQEALDGLAGVRARVLRGGSLSVGASASASVAASASEGQPAVLEVEAP
jgi:MOSC domain-containing protein YiiM